jgi:predicted HAD superfamily Cof-like phosphohydrolase
MVMDECSELLRTVTDTPVDSLKEIVDKVKEPAVPKMETDRDIILAQTDAFVDIVYYILNAVAKNTLPFDEMFAIVHKANNDKRFPDGMFHCREDGKVIKPEGWKEPDFSNVKLEYEEPQVLRRPVDTSVEDEFMEDEESEEEDIPLAVQQFHKVLEHLVESKDTKAAENIRKLLIPMN